MPLFHYTTIDSKGKKVLGAIDAESEREAKEKLRSKELFIVSLATKKAPLPFTRKSQHLKGEDLITFTTQLAELLNSGIPLYESLVALEEQYRGESFHPCLAEICESIKKGSSLSATLKQFPESFSPLYVAMVLSGESVGILDKALQKLALLLTKQAKLKKQLTTALIYPSVLFSFSCVVVLLLLTFVIPSMEELFEGQSVNGLTGFVIALSHFVRNSWIYFAVALPLFIFALSYLKKTEQGIRKWDELLLKLPFCKATILHASFSRFTRTLGTLMDGGVSIISALEISRKVMRNQLLEEVVIRAENRIVQGSFLSVELKKSPLVPHLIPRMLAIGEEGGKTALMCHKIADLYEEEVEKSLNRLVAIIQPATLIFMGAIVGIIMLGVLLPLTDVNAFIQN